MDVLKYLAANKPENQTTSTQDNVPGVMEKTADQKIDDKLDKIEQSNMRFDRTQPGVGDMKDEQSKQAYADNQVSRNRYGAPKQTNDDLYASPESLGADASQKGWIEEVGTSFMKGVGNHVVGGFGDMAQVLGGWTGLSDMYDGNPLSNSLQELGENIAGNNEVFIPEELKDPKFQVKTMMDPRFWSTYGAEFVPQLAEFILLSKGAGTLFKKGVQAGGKAALEGGLIKSAKGTAKNIGKKLGAQADEAYELAGTGKGLGKLITDAGELTAQTGRVVETVGAGMGGNVLSGMLNAAEAYNTRKDMKNPDGSDMFTKDELADIAGKTFTNNLKWMGIDMLSWGMTYGSGGKMLKNSNLYRKGKQAFSKQKILKDISGGFTAEMSPVLRKIAHAGKKGIAEGFEETFQETFESWAAIRAEEEVTGKPSKYKNYWDFYNSAENEATKAIAFGLGLLGGASFGMVSDINKKAERARQLYDRTENLKTIFDDGDQEGKEWQEYHKREVMQDVILNKKEQHFDAVVMNMVEKGIMTEEEVAESVELFQEYETLAQQATNLNIRGKYALMQNHSLESFFEKHLEDKKSELSNNINIVNSSQMTDAQKKSKIRQMEKTYDEEVKPIIAGMSQATANKSSLILGEPIENVVNVQFSTNEAGKSVVNVGLNNSDYDYYVNDSDEDIMAPQTKVKSFFKSISVDGLSSMAKNIFRTNKKNESAPEEEVEGSPGNTEEVTPDNTGEASDVQPGEESKKKAETKEEDLGPITDQEIEELATLEQETADLEETKATLEKEKKSFQNPKKPYTEKQQAKADQALEKLDADINALDQEILTRKPRYEELTKKAKAEKQPDSEAFYQENEKVSFEAPETLVKVNPTDKTIHPNVIQQILKKLKVGKLSKRNQEIYDNFQDVIEKTADAVGGATKEFQTFVNKQETKTKAKNFKKQVKKQAKDVKARIDKAIKAQFSSDIFGKESRPISLDLAKAYAEASISNQPFEVNSIGRIKYGPSNLDKMVAINERLTQVFPKANKKVTAFILDNLAQTIGIEGVGYTIGSSVFVQSNAWDQGEVFMHEMAHIFYKFGQNSPETQEFLKKIKTNKKLLDAIENRYPDYILYQYGKDIDGRPLIGRNTANMSAADMKANNIVKLPIEEQKHILEEAFVHTLQGPLSKKYNSFFSPREEFQRQKSAMKWWSLININATKDPTHMDDTKELLEKLNDNKPLSESNMRDFIVSEFKNNVDLLGDDEIGFEARTEDFKAATIERKNEIRDRFEKEQASFQKSVFDNTTSDTSIDEILDEEFTEEQLGDDPIINIMERTFASRASKATKILNNFTNKYNRAIRLRRVFGMKDKVLFDRKEFNYRMLELAKYSPDAYSFVDMIETSPMEDIKAFNKFLELTAPDQKTILLGSIWFTMSNHRNVAALNTALYVDKDGNTIHSIEEALSMKEKTLVQNAMEGMVEARRSNTSQDGNMIGDEWQTFVDNIAKVKDNTATKEDYIAIYKFLAVPGIKISDIWDYGYVNVMGKNYHPITVLKAFFQKDRHLETKGQFAGDINPYKFAPLLNAIAVTNRSFTQDSVVQNAEGNMVPVRITNNHMTKEIDGMVKALRPNANGDVMTKEDFLDRYSHINRDLLKVKGFKTPVPNLFLDNFYDSVVNKDIVPDIVYYTGINDLRDKKANSFGSSTAYEQSFEDLMMFVESGTAGTFLNNMGTFGDSPRKFYMSAPKVKRSQSNTTSMYNIYRNIVKDPMSKSAFESSINKDIIKEIALINSNGALMSKISKMNQYFGKDNRLNENGKKMVSDYVYNVTANGLYKAEVFSPNIEYNEIAKRLKNSSSPVMSVNDKLKFEPIFFKDPKLAGTDATDGGMYILEEDAARWRNAGLGVFDLNHGFKFLNYSVEKDNPTYKSQTLLLKGYTTVLNQAEIDKNPALKGVYDLLKARSKKYAAWHNEAYGGDPSTNFADGLPNSFPIAMPLSSEKGDIYKRIDNAGVLSLTELNGSDQETSEAAIKRAEDYIDKTMYSEGKYIGMQGYNFGPQQVMDKQTENVVVPVQQINAIIVAAEQLGHTEKAEAIQKLYSDVMNQALNNITEKLKTNDPQVYKDFIEGEMDKEAMDQVQRFIIETYGIMHPRALEIVTNQLANSLKVAGNKLKTSGTYAHQKSDIGYRLPNGASVNGSSTLENYQKNPDGSLKQSQIILPGHLNGKVRARQYYTFDSELGGQTLNFTDKRPTGSRQNVTDTKLDIQFNGEPESRVMDLAVLKTAAELQAKKHGVKAWPVKKKGQTIGYYVEGETVIATRVPSNGPSFTGIFEAVDFSPGQGNQVIVPTEFTATIGADLDGDALFIQYKGGDKKISEAIDRIAKLWLSPAMAPIITTKMNTKEAGNKLKAIVKKHFKTENENATPFSPAARRKSYEDSMIAKRNIGTVFNLHRVSNVLANYVTRISKEIQIDNDPIYNTFEDKGIGEESRNHKSALVANLILDNLKEQTADALNINEHTVSAFSILTNLNVPLEKTALMMNAPLVKEYVRIYNENNSAFHGYTRRAAILEQLARPEKGKISYTPTKQQTLRPVISDPSNQAFFSSENQSAIIDMIMEMENVNSEIQAISKIMAGHNGIETNPYLLEKQIARFKEVMNNEGSDAVLTIQEAMAKNPDMVRYLNTAEATLVHTKKLNPVYRPVMTELLTRLSQSINNDVLTDNQIKKYTGTLMQFINSRVSSINNRNPEEIKALVTPRNKKNIHSRFSQYVQKVKAEGNLESNLLLSQGLNMKLTGNGAYISLNSKFFDESVSKQEIKRMQSEFDQIPGDLQYDLLAYDLLSNGWGSPLSMLPIMGYYNYDVNQGYQDDFNSKENTPISQKVMDEVERIIVLKDANGKRNNFIKFDAAGRTAGDFAKQLQKNPVSNTKLQKNEPFYYTSPDKKGGLPILFRFNGMPADVFKKPFDTKNQKMAHLALQVGPNSTKIGKEKNADLDIDLITISDLKKKDRTDPLEGFTNEPLEGKEAREEYWEYDAETIMDQETFEATMEFTKYDNAQRKESMYQKYQKAKKKANKIFKDNYADTNFRDMEPEELLAIYDDYASKDAYAYAIITTPIIKALANKVAMDQQQNFKGRQQGTKDISFMSSYLMANNIPSDHPAVAGMVRIMETKHKEFVAEKVKYLKKINEATDALYRDKFNFDFNKKTPWNILKRFYYTFFLDRSSLYQTLYGNIVEINEIAKNGRLINEFKLKSEGAIEQLKKEGRLSDAEYNFYKMFRATTEELAPYSVEKNGRKRRDYIPHTSMGFFESFSNRGILGLLQNSRPENEQVFDVKMYLTNPETEEKQLLSFKQIDDIYKAMSADQGNNYTKTAEYVKLRLKAKSLLKKGLNEDGSKLESDPMGIATALNMGIMNRFSNSRSVSAEDMPSMDLNHALSSYVHSTLFVNGNANVTGFKHMQGIIDGILAQSDAKGFRNISKYVKINWKDAYLKNKKQVLLGRKGDQVVDLITKLNLFYQLGFKASYVLGNVAAGKYHNVKNHGGKHWLDGEKRFWGTDRGFNPLEAVKRFKRSQKILQTINFLDINVYDNVSIASKSRLDNFFGDLALMPMAWSEKWIQGVQFLGLLTEEEWNKFDDDGNYKPFTEEIPVGRVTELENEVKKSQGKGYQVTDQRMVQQYSMGRMFMQFSRFIPTMFHDRFAQQDVDIYGKENIGSLRALYNMVVQVQSMKPADYVAYRKSLSPEMRKRLDSGLRGFAMSGLIGAFAIETNNRFAENTYWDANYYANFDKLAFKLKPSAVRSTQNLINSIL